MNLKEFLKTTFNWDWIDNATIIPIFNENIIYIKDNSESSDATSNNNNNIRMVIDEIEDKAVLKQNGESLCEFVITRNRHTPFEDLCLSIDIRTIENRNRISYKVYC